MKAGEGKTFSWVKRKYAGGEFGYFCEQKCAQCQGCQSFSGDISKSNINDFGIMNSFHLLMWCGKDVTGYKDIQYIIFNCSVTTASDRHFDSNDFPQRETVINYNHI